MLSWVRIVLDLLLPRTCAPCGSAIDLGAPSPLCVACTAAIVAPEPAGGAGHGAHRPDPAPPVTLGTLTSVRALGPYVGGPSGNVLACTIQHLKYRGARDLAAPLGQLLSVHYPFPDDALLVPVPLHPSRLRARGYNQALLLARALARRRRLALAPRLLERTRATAEHAALGAAARHANVRGAFRLRRGHALTHDTIVLVDDVFTTGATAAACAEPLRAAGARTVHVYTVGRTP
jgi:ComF family protein